jgi:splicing factor 3A subunit 3
MEETEEAPPVEVIKIDNGESDEESDDGTIFNPLKLPLGECLLLTCAAWTS